MAPSPSRARAITTIELIQSLKDEITECRKRDEAKRFFYIAEEAADKLELPRAMFNLGD